MPRFRPSLNASTIRGTPLFRQIEVAACSGFHGIELWFDDVDRCLSEGDEDIAAIRRALDSSGLSVPTLIYLGDWFDAPDARWPAVKDLCRRRLAMAAALGAPHVIAGPPGHAADLSHGACHYRELLEIGKAEGSLPSFEFLGFVDEYRTVDSAVEVLKAAELPEGTTILDPFHIFRGGGSVDSIARLKGSQIAVSHFNDAPAQPPREQQHDADRVWPGDGHLDLRHYLDLIAATGYRSWLSLELFRPDLWARDPFEVARIAFDRLEPYLGE